jgi:uncharacterized protein
MMKKLLSIFILLLASLLSFSQDKFDLEKLLQQKPNKLVNDYTTTLTADQQQVLENKLVAFDDSTSTQIAVVIIPTLNGNDVTNYGVKLGRAWGVGGKEHNNGVLLLIVNGDRANGDKKLYIGTGYGVEGALPDITAKHIIEDVIVPNFKGDDYYRGIEEGTDAIIQAVKGEYKAPEGYRSGKGWGGRIIFIIIMIIIFLAASSGKGGGGSFMSRRGFAAWTIASMLSGSGGRGGGGWSGGGGSSGGGGFGGFGGGSFGGGGASGSW